MTDGRTNKMPKKYKMSSLFMEKTYNSLNVIVFFNIIYGFWGLRDMLLNPFKIISLTSS